MVPALFVHLAALPQTPNGKIDRAALPAPGVQRATTSRAPASATEQQVAALWRELLGVDTVGAEDNFFDLGGHSLLAMRAHGRIREQTGTDLPLRAMFESATLADYCRSLDLATSASVALPPPVAEGGFVPVSFAQEAAWLLHQVEGGSEANTIAATVQIDGELDRDALRDAFAGLVRRHAVLRTTYHFADGRLLQRVNPVQPLELPLLEAVGEDAIAAAKRTHASAPFDLERGPLLRLALLARAPQRHELLIAIHHIAADAGSVRIALAEVQELYAARIAARSPALPGLHRQYPDFALWQRSELVPATMQARLKRWTEHMHPVPPTLDLRPDRARPARRSFDGATRRIQLDPAGFDALRQAGQRAGATPFMTLMAAYAIVLHGRSGQTDIAIGAPLAQRPRHEFEPLIGFFVDTLVVRNDLSAAPTFTELLTRVRSATLEAHEHAVLPFQARIDALALPADAGVTPLFQTWLNYVPREPETPPAALQLRVTDDAISVAKYDLMLTGLESAEGLRLDLTYNTAMFDAASADALLQDVLAVIRNAAAEPARTLSQLLEAVAVARRESQARVADADRSSLAALAGRRRVAPRAAGEGADAATAIAPRRRATVVSAATLVRETALFGDEGLARRIDADGSQLELLAWFDAERARLDRLLSTHGAVLLRGFRGAGIDSFNTLVGRLGRPLRYTFRSTPRSQLADAVYTSTEYPASEWIPQHNENAYASSWPQRLAFHCVIAPASGGATPLADSRRVYQALDPEVRARFAERGVMYVRNFGRGVDLSWQEAFQTSDRAEVDRYCAGAGIVAEWQADGGLRTRNVCPAMRLHPVSGEPVWFNQAHLFHVSALAPELARQLLDSFGADGVPRNAFYGDGSPIEDDALAAIRAAYAAHTRAFPWQVGDVLLVDNMLCTHGREPFEGARRIVVGMADASDGITE
jgi:alpha-ketoglutarate-dependent taurine dioxygenase